MPHYSWRACILLVILVLCPSVAYASANLSQCFMNIASCAYEDNCQAVGITTEDAMNALTTSNGSRARSKDDATSISYRSCANICGFGQESFNWTVFSQECATWLLPYLALLSQLPFGAPRRLDNLMSVALTLGSPTLAGYSLYMTLLNARWVNDYLFLGVDYPSPTVRQSVVCVLASLQQVTLRVHPGKSGRFESLVVHPNNDEWWNVFAKELDYTHTWSIASATSITWVVIAYLLTVADSMSNVSENIGASGQGTGSVWLWLLPIVVGWLVLSPKCHYDRVQEAYCKANGHVVVADCHDATATPRPVTCNFGVTIDVNGDWRERRNVASPDELRTPPIFNYARVFPWARHAHLTALFYRSAWRRSNRREGVDGSTIPGNIHNDVPQQGRLGTCQQTIDYCSPENYDHQQNSVLCPPGVFSNMVIASLMALQLQWGTTFAAVVVVYFTPTIGIGCRSLAYLIYGALSTAVWALLVLSSSIGYYAQHVRDEVEQLAVDPEGIAVPLAILGHVTNGNNIPLHDVSEESRTISTVRGINSGWMRHRELERLADWLRWIGKSIAVANAIGIIVVSVFQYANVFDNCYCNSSVFSWGEHAAFNVIELSSGDINLARSAWLGALAMSLTCSVFFLSCIYLIRDSFP